MGFERSSGVGKGGKRDYILNCLMCVAVGVCDGVGAGILRI